MSEYFEFKPKGCNGCIIRKNDIIDMIEGLEDDEIVEVTKLKMTDEEFEKLPEFEGF